jgi:phage tail sheath protein FI
MPDYLSPGVFIEEIDAGPRPVAGVSTSTTGMVGITARGPAAGKPVLVTNFLEFQRTFGGFRPEPDPAVADAWRFNAAEGGQWWNFPLAVKGFFDNGGERLYVKRVVSGGATTSAGSLGAGLTSEITVDAAAGATTVHMRHLLGFTGVGQAVTVCRGDDGRELHQTTVAAYSTSGGSVDLADPLPVAVRAARGDFVRVGAPVTAPQPGQESLTFNAVSPGAWGDDLRVRVRPMTGAVLTVLPDLGEGRLFVTRLAAPADADSATVQVAAAGGLDPAALPAEFWILVGGARYQVSGVSGPDAQDRVEFSFPAGTTHPAWPAGTAVQRVRRATVDGPHRTLRVGGASRLYRDAVVQLDDGTRMSVHRVVGATADSVEFDGDLGRPVFENDRLYLVEAEVTARFAGATGDTAQETFTNLRLTGDDPASLVRALESRSRLIRAAAGPNLNGRDPAAFPTAPAGSWLTLAGGDDGLAGLTPADFIGTDGGSGARTGIVALEDIDEIAICAVPGMWSGSVQSALVTHCESLKDRFAILDPQDGLDIEGIRAFRAPFDTRYAALYYPWLVTTHPVTGVDVEIAPSGHVAGIYARTDAERGVHKAPANAVIRGIRLRDGIAQDITRRQQDLLNPGGINALRFFPGQGHRVWGARTLSSDPAWKYVNVRRLFLFLEESIDKGTQWVVFEPNGEPLWALVRQTVANFLGTVWRTGALAGTTPDEAFFVACDRTTMTEEDLENGRLVCVVGVAPVFPAEFVIFRIHQQTRETVLT